MHSTVNIICSKKKSVSALLCFIYSTSTHRDSFVRLIVINPELNPTHTAERVGVVFSKKLFRHPLSLSHHTASDMKCATSTNDRTDSFHLDKTKSVKFDVSVESSHILLVEGKQETSLRDKAELQIHDAIRKYVFYTFAIDRNTSHLTSHSFTSDPTNCPVSWFEGDRQNGGLKRIIGGTSSCWTWGATQRPIRGCCEGGLLRSEGTSHQRGIFKSISYSGPKGCKNGASAQMLQLPISWW